MNREITGQINAMRAFFATGVTKNVSYRKEQLRNLRKSILSHQKEIEDALKLDIRKSPEEAYLTEISVVINEIDLHISKLSKWSRTTKVHSPLYLMPSHSRVYYEPLGLVLIFSAWNYPFQLILNPLIGAISSGCVSVLRPSPYAPHTARVVEDIISSVFASEYVYVVQGDKELNTDLLKERYDYIFFTGGANFAKVVYEAAARNLTPVTLELGGKSPCIVDACANLKIAARRIAWGKWLNAGQTCVAPDYLLVHSSVKDEFLKLLVVECEAMYGTDASKSPYYPRIISSGALERLCSLFSTDEVYYGGESNIEDKYLSPTILHNVSKNSQLMNEEIFGPLLPVITYDDINDAIAYINEKDKPLALYYFGNKGSKILNESSSGGACINDTIMHLSNPELPFGGVGASGMGVYHGYYSFLQFSNKKSVVHSPTWLDMPFRYPPFKYFKFIKRIL